MNNPGVVIKAPASQLYSVRTYSVKQMVERLMFSNKAHLDSQTPPMKLHLLTSCFLLPFKMPAEEKNGECARKRSESRYRGYTEGRATSGLKIYSVHYKK